MVGPTAPNRDGGGAMSDGEQLFQTINLLLHKISLNLCAGYFLSLDGQRAL